MSKKKDNFADGWAFPFKSKKVHWFADGRSLCGSWLFFGATETGDNASPDNCRACRKKLEKLESVKS